MTDESLIVKPRDYSDIIKLQEPGVLEEFFDEPLSFIAETVTGALAAGKAGWFLASGRIVQGMLKAKLLQQFSKEVKKFRDAGKIEKDFAETKYGGQTWVELMRIIDEESPDADRLEALKAMFFAINKVGTTDGERIKAYQLWQIAKKLNSGELLLLKTVFECKDAYGHSVDPQIRNKYPHWRTSMSSVVSHGSEGLIELHQKKPTDFGLLTPITPNIMGDIINVRNARLSDLGLAFCANIETYVVELREVSVEDGAI